MIILLILQLYSSLIIIKQIELFLMGQHHNKPTINLEYFTAFYEENISHQYFTSTKGFGYKKTNIKSTNRQKICNEMSNSLSNIDEHRASEKLVKKKQFQPSTYPYSCIGLLIVHYKDRCMFGTGCLVGPNLVLTAASNIYNKQTGQHPESVRFALGVTENDGDIYVIKSKINIPEKYIEESNGSHRYNYAILEIQSHLTKAEQNIEEEGNNDNVPGLVYGYLGINTRFSGQENIYIYGCSMDFIEEKEVSFAIRGQKIDKLMCKYGSIAYKMESNQSECGSPILIRRNEYYHIVGIHICGKKELGTGLQVDEAMRSAINSWICVNEGRLDLSAKSLDPKNLSLLIQYDWRKLVVLNLDGNRLACTGLIVLTKVDWPVLRQLHISSNGIVKLQFETSSLKNLQILYLSKNSIKDIDIISDLPILKVLELSDNKIDNVNELKYLKYLERLYLNGNKINKLPIEIEKWSQLKKIELSRNDLDSIPVEILKLKNLSLISLDGNRSKFKDNDTIKRLVSSKVQVILH